ncbi:MAG: MFS transporter, partial [Candidatus Omnitrophica bacterium]|nr:MFS transporter [Candidatus Omnitrophota bacterium]
MGQSVQHPPSGGAEDRDPPQLGPATVIGLPRAYRYDLTAGLLVGIFEGLTAPFIGVVARQLGGSVLQVALLTSVPLLGHTLSLFWASRQVHFESPVAYVTFATSISRVMFLGMAWVQGPAAFVACACMAQFLAPVHSPAYTEVMRQIYPEGMRGKAMGSVRMCASVSTMLAASVGGKLLDLIGFRLVFPVAAVAGVAASWTFSQIPYPAQRPALAA